MYIYMYLCFSSQRPWTTLMYMQSSCRGGCSGSFGRCRCQGGGWLGSGGRCGMALTSTFGSGFASTSTFGSAFASTSSFDVGFALTSTFGAAFALTTTFGAAFDFSVFRADFLFGCVTFGGQSCKDGSQGRLLPTII